MYIYAVGSNKEGKNWKTTMKRIHCLEQTHFAIGLFLYMISDHKFEYQTCSGLKSKMFNSDVWAEEENSPGSHISGTLPKEARWWPTTHQWRYRSLSFRPAFSLCHTHLSWRRQKSELLFQKSEREWERACLWKL